MEMDDRKYFILGAVLRSYLEDREPIGSRTLKRNFQMDVSAATIRNEMSDLEALGYLEKTHTSSGRVPSEKAFRWYVDEILKRGWDKDSIPQLPTRALISETNDPKKLISSVLTFLSDITNTTSLALLPGREEDILQKIRFIPLSDQNVLILFVFRSKFIHTELVHLTDGYTEARLKRAGEIFSELLEDRPLIDIDDFLHSPFFSGEYVCGNVVSELVPIIREIIRSHREPSMIIEGLAKLYQSPEADSEKITFFIDQLRQEKQMVNYLKSFEGQKEISVRIGSENLPDWLQESTLIVAPYKISGNFHGALGVIGPIIMPYRTVMNDVSRMGRYVNSITMRK